jgi:hypothetical protein
VCLRRARSKAQQWSGMRIAASSSAQPKPTLMGCRALCSPCCGTGCPRPSWHHCPWTRAQGQRGCGRSRRRAHGGAPRQQTLQWPTCVARGVRAARRRTHSAFRGGAWRGACVQGASRGAAVEQSNAAPGEEHVGGGLVLWRERLGGGVLQFWVSGARVILIRELH